MLNFLGVNISLPRRPMFLCAIFFFLPLLLGADETGQRRKLESEKEHYDRQLAAYRKSRDFVEHGGVSEAQWLAAQNLEDSGMDALKELSVVTSMRDIVKSLQADKLKGVVLTPGAAQLLYLGEAALKAYKANSDYEKRIRSGLASDPGYRASTQAELDQAISAVESLKRPLPYTDSKFGFKQDKKLECVMGATLSTLYLLKSGLVKDDTERLQLRAKAGKEASEVILKIPTFGQVSATSYAEAVNPALNRSAVLTLDKILAEEAARFMVAGVAISWADSMRTEALLRKENTLSELNYRIMVADYERDKVLAAQRRLERGQRLKEPGGIKFSSVRADELGRNLDVDSIDYDPVRGRLVLSGKKSQEAFDLDLFREVLQLAVEESEPFFSMEPSVYQDWDWTANRIAGLLREKYTSEALIARVHDLCRQPIAHDGKVYYYATTDQLDPVLAAEANRGVDISEKLVFSPNWLRYSRLGWILYEADMAIKGVAAGFLERWPEVIPSPAWDMPDFKPSWLLDGEHYAGRANFELEEAGLLDAEGRRSLGDVRPKLVVAAREPGSPTDLQPTPPWCREISEHFSRNWASYVQRIPELRRLQTVYKAYVAARLLVREHPGLAERIRGLTPPIDWHEQPPLRTIRPRVVRVCYVDDKPASIKAGCAWNIGGGYGGGAAVKMSNLNPEARTAPSAPWTGAELLAPLSMLDVEEHGDRAAVPIEIELEPPAPEPLERATVAVVVALLVWALVGAALGRWDWQQLAQQETCAHCIGVHAWAGRVATIGSVTTASALLFLAGLPLLLAGQTEAEIGQPLLTSALLIPGAIAILIVVGRVFLALLRRTNVGVLQEFVAGSQVVAFGLLVALCRHGLSGSAILGTWRDLYGVEIAERLLVRLANPEVVVWAVWSLAAGWVVAVVSRSLAPFLSGSRPLLLSSVPFHRHSS